MKIKVEISDEVLNKIRAGLESMAKNYNRKFYKSSMKKITNEIVEDILDRYLDLAYISDDDLESYVLEYFTEIK